MMWIIRKTAILALVIVLLSMDNGFSYNVQAKIRANEATTCSETESSQAESGYAETASSPEGSNAQMKENSPEESVLQGTESIQDESNIQGTGTVSEEENPLSFSIDAAHKYEGMEQPYKQGYKPTVTDTSALIVLPLKSSFLSPDLTVRALVDLGDPSDTPFVYTNLEKDFRLRDMPYFDEKNEKSGSESIFYIRYTLKLRKEHPKGVYPIRITIQASDKKYGPVEQVFTVYVTIKKDTIKQDDTPGTEPSQQVPAETKPSSAPCVLVSDYKLNPETVTAGQTFTASVTLKNTSKKKSVQNMVLTIDCQDSVFTLEEPSDSIFLDTLGAGKTKTVTFKYHTDLETEEGHYRIHLSMTYDDSNAMTYSSSGQITVNVKQESKVELVAPRIESEYTAGDTIPLAFQVLNLGRNKIYNVRCEAKGYGMLPVNTAYIGDMEAGTEGNATLNLFITQKTKSPDYQGTEPYGLTEGTLTLIYEDADGKEYTDERPFTSSILAQVYSVTTDTDAPKGKSALLWWIAILAGGLLLTAMLLSFFYYKRKKAKN